MLKRHFTSKFAAMRKYLLLLLFIIIAFYSNGQVKVACVGNSITYGSGIENRDKNSYPAKLQALAGEDWQVKNFGVSGATMLKKGDKPYWQQEAFREALIFEPDVVIIKLGTNDTKPQNWQYADQYISNYLDMIEQFETLSSQPKIFICLPVPAFEERWDIRPSVVKKEVVPAVRKIARKTDTHLINLYKPFKKKSELFPDHIHPNAAGAALMAEIIYDHLQKHVN